MKIEKKIKLKDLHLEFYFWFTLPHHKHVKSYAYIQKILNFFFHACIDHKFMKSIL